MAAQGERVSGVLGIDVMLDPMAQDEIPEQDSYFDWTPDPDPWRLLLFNLI